MTVGLTSRLITGQPRVGYRQFFWKEASNDEHVFNPTPAIRALMCRQLLRHFRLNQNSTLYSSGKKSVEQPKVFRANVALRHNDAEVRQHHWRRDRTPQPPPPMLQISSQDRLGARLRPIADYRYRSLSTCKYKVYANYRSCTSIIVHSLDRGSDIMLTYCCTK